MLKAQLLAVLAAVAVCLGCTSQNVQNASPGQAQQAAAGDQVAARHILIMYEGSMRAPPRVTRTKEEAKALIEEIQGKLEQGETFENLAMDHSDCPSAAKGGDLGRFGHNQMAPPFEKAAFACEVDGVTEIVETDFGYHLINRYE